MRKSPQVLLWSALGLVVLLLAVLVGGSLWVRSFLKSEDFRRLVAEKTGTALEGEANYSPLRWEGSSVFSDSLTVAGSEKSILKELKTELIRAQVNWRAIFDGAWRVDSITATSLQLTLGPTKPGPARVELSTVKPSGLRGWLPDRFELGEATFAQSRVQLVDGTGLMQLSINDTRLTLKPEGTGWLIDGERGSLTIPGQPTASIDSFRSRLQGGTYFLTDARLRLGETGKITASGEFSESSRLQLAWEQVDCRPFLPDQWKSRLSGKVNGSAEVAWPAAGMSQGTVVGKFELVDGMLQDLPLLDQIATFTSAPQFKRMPIQRATGNYSWKDGDLTLTDLMLESKGLLKVTGHCLVKTGGELQGTFRVGVTPQTLQWLPGSRERVFTSAQDGYLWTDVKVSGTLENMREDLSSRLVHAMRNEAIDQGGALLNTLPGPARDGAQQALDLLKPLLP